MTKIREQVSNILGFTIMPDEWDKSFEELDREGRFTKRHLIKFILLLLKLEESRENA